jgi:hypothetical protein
LAAVVVLVANACRCAGTEAAANEHVRSNIDRANHTNRLTYRMHPLTLPTYPEMMSVAPTTTVSNQTEIAIFIGFDRILERRDNHEILECNCAGVLAGSLWENKHQFCTCAHNNSTP